MSETPKPETTESISKWVLFPATCNSSKMFAWLKENTSLKNKQAWFFSKKTFKVAQKHKIMRKCNIIHIVSRKTHKHFLTPSERKAFKDLRQILSN